VASFLATLFPEAFSAVPALPVMKLYRSLKNKEAGRMRRTTIFISVILGLSILSLVPETARAQIPRPAGATGTGNAKSPAANAATKIKFKPYEVIDRQLGMPANRIAIPEDWTGVSRLDWDINAYYVPVHGHIRVEAADGSSWVEDYPLEMFVWANPALDRGPYGVRDGSGAIRHPNITLPEALVRYAIAPNRRNVRNLRIVGYRPVNNLPRAFLHVFPNDPPRGNGICMRVQYDLNGVPVDEEFYGFMPPTDAIPAQPAGMEYHSYLMLAHSIGAKSGKLESMRPLLGFIATSIEVNPAWQQQFNQIHQAQLDRATQNLAQSWANLALAKQLSAQAHASNEASIARTEAGLAQSRQQQAAAHASYGAGSNDDFYRRADGFDQYLRGTEHMQDQNGAVSDQYTDYNYHWTDANGTFVHTNDSSFDPNRYLNGSFQQMTPVRK
jgi:hypothetical protein